MTYIIGEIGQNHNGSVDIAKVIIDLANKPVVDELFGLELPKMNAVKLTKRDLSEELTNSQMSAPYENANSFGKTYGEHRAFLELSDEEHFEVYKYAKSLGFDFVETLCSIGCLTILDYFTPDYLKVASRDLTNLPLLDALAATKIPIIVSTGMAGQKELDDAIETISKYHDKITILHCVSQYPTHPKNVNLRTISYLIEKYPEYTIGYSDHTIGISAPTAAVALGAQVIEKHITIDRDMKGTDQKGSLGPEGLWRMIRDIRLMEDSLGRKEIYIEPNTVGAKNKLERSIATLETLVPGHVIKEEDLHLLSPGDGIKWVNRDQLVGKTVKNKIDKNELIYLKDVN